MDIIDIQAIGNRAVKKAIKELHDAGLPAVFSYYGKTIYELPDRTITTFYDFEKPKN
jgi:hypothetical protein